MDAVAPSLPDAPARPGRPAQPWPRLREELMLHPGPVGADGAPSWSLQDPARQQFFRIDWPSYEILARWHLGDAGAIADEVGRRTPLDLDAGDVERVAQFLADHQLVQVDTPERAALLHARHEGAKTGAANWLLHHYLFFRVPLLKPDRWLHALLPWAAPFYTRAFLHLTLAVLLAGLWMVTRQWDRFAGTLVDMLTPAGFLHYGLMLVAVKALHELGHAVTAKRLGCRVPTMGVAFLVMWPVAYTDVTEAWKLTRRRDRLAVGAAGIATELALAAWATLAWALLPDGGLRSLCFVLATTTWISTLLINASPIMRFDGYFLLSDLLDMPNLHARAFALARWRLREVLFALGEEPPEHFPPARRNGLVLFAFAVWIYRLVLFLGIAAMVYHHFFKALGLVLFFVEIGWFIVLPIWNELRAWRLRWPVLRRRRGQLSLAVLAVLLLLVAVPWQTQVEAQGLLRPRHYPLHAAVPGQLQQWNLAPGQAVRRDQPLFAIASPELQLRGEAAALKVARTEWQVSASGVDETLRARQPVLQEERRGARAEQAGVQDELATLAPTAPFDGLVVDVPPDVQAGTWVARHERLGTVVDLADWKVQVYLPEAEIERIRVGDAARFYSETPGRATLPLAVADIDRDATRVLPEPQLALGHGGELGVRERRNQLVPDQAVYRVTLKATVPPAEAAQLPHLRGHVVIQGRAHSMLGGVARTAAATLMREAGW